MKSITLAVTSVMIVILAVISLIYPAWLPAPGWLRLAHSNLVESGSPLPSSSQSGTW